MSSRCTFTSNYIYNPEAVKDLAERLKEFGWGIKASGSNQGAFQVVGMIKGADHFKSDLIADLKTVIEAIKEEHDIKYDITLAFVGDETTSIITVSTNTNLQFYNHGVYNVHKKE